MLEWSAQQLVCLTGDIQLDPGMQASHILQGIIYEGRKERKGNLSPQKAAFARSASNASLARQAQTDLSKAVELIGPDALIGAAAQGGAFSESVVRTLTKVLTDGLPSLPSFCMLRARASVLWQQHALQADIHIEMQDEGIL